ncbi:MAG: YebC/PmpR family DNA-binding transcriptional regulator [Dehalococcoidia bacterium]|jgi:YebC/PmpR family DNA-binding regulatory protein|nr:YebC/PmpR family DNA-binding transcriptional regulator [Dehalococcoidia bacterium]
MSGHSHWATIKRQKGVGDARRGLIFTKLAREIMIAVRASGPSLDSNYALRLVMEKARDANMPSENIERAIKRAAGGGEGANLAEFTLEGYGPSGVAVLITTLSDNRNRTVQEIRSTLTRYGGSLGETGCVSWQFDSRGVIVVETDEENADEVALMAIDAGALDVKTDGGYVEVYTDPSAIETVRKALESRFKVTSADFAMVPKTTILVDDTKAGQILSFIDQLEQLDDVRRVFSNADFSESALEGLQQA